MAIVISGTKINTVGEKYSPKYDNKINIKFKNMYPLLSLPDLSMIEPTAIVKCIHI